MNNSGFTKIEVLAVICIFSVIYLVSSVNVSHAFNTDIKQDEYDQKIILLEKQTENYVLNNMNLFEEEDTVYVYVNDLIENKYLVANENGDIVNPLKPNDNLNNLKFKVKKDGEDIKVSLLKI